MEMIWPVTPLSWQIFKISTSLQFYLIFAIWWLWFLFQATRSSSLSLSYIGIITTWGKHLFVPKTDVIDGRVSQYTRSRDHFGMAQYAMSWILILFCNLISPFGSPKYVNILQQVVDKFICATLRNTKNFQNFNPKICSLRHQESILSSSVEIHEAVIRLAKFEIQNVNLVFNRVG